MNSHDEVDDGCHEAECEDAAHCKLEAAAVGDCVFVDVVHFGFLRAVFYFVYVYYYNYVKYHKTDFAHFCGK